MTKKEGCNVFFEPNAAIIIDIVTISDLSHPVLITLKSVKFEFNISHVMLPDYGLHLFMLDRRY